MALFSFVGYACLYFEINKQSDTYQARFVGLVSAAGFGVAMSLGFGVWISTFVVTPRAVILGLLLSDLVHLMVPRLRYSDDERVEDDAVVAEKI